MRTLEQMASSWLNQTKSTESQNKWSDALNSLTISPTEQAASDQAMSSYLDGVQRSVTSGYRAKRLRAVSLGDYKAMVTAKKGNLSRITDASKQKYIKNMGPIYPALQQAKEAVRNMPKGGEANALARVAAVRRILKQAAGKDPS